jgi:hypothetical protein
LIVFLFFDSLVLPILYSILFIYIRRQSNNFFYVVSTNGHSTTSDDIKLEPPASISTSPTANAASTRSEPIDSMMPKPRVTEAAERARRRMNQVAVTLLCYPLAYLLLTAPILVIPIASFLEKNIPISVVYVLSSVYTSTGWVNVILYTITRKGIVSWHRLLRWRKRPQHLQSTPGPKSLGISTFQAPVTTDELDYKTTASSSSQERGYTSTDSGSGYPHDNYVAAIIPAPRPVKLVHSRSCLLGHSSISHVPGETNIMRTCNCNRPLEWKSWD